jgi:hypothetical protein
LSANFPAQIARTAGFFAGADEKSNLRNFFADPEL